MFEGLLQPMHLIVILLSHCWSSDPANFPSLARVLATVFANSKRACAMNPSLPHKLV